MTTVQDVGKVVCLRHRPSLPPGNAPGTDFCWKLSRPQGHSAIRKILCQWKIPMTPAGIEPATFRFVAQHLNHCATAVPIYICIYINNWTSVESRQCEQHSCFLFERSLIQISAWRPDVLPEASSGVGQSLNTHITTISPATPLRTLD